MSDLAAWEDMENEWSAKVDRVVERVKVYALVYLMRRCVEHRQREHRAAEVDLRLALERVERTRADLSSALDTLEDAIRLAGKREA